MRRAGADNMEKSRRSSRCCFAMQANVLSCLLTGYLVRVRLRLWQRLFLAFAVLSGVALFGFAAWLQQNFRRGFLGYLDEVTLQRLAPANARLAAAYSEHGGWDFLREDSARLGELIEPSPAKAWESRAPGDG